MITYEDQPPEEYTYEDYLADAATVSAGLVALLLAFGNPFQLPRLSPRDWQNFLRVIYPHVEEARTEIAELARRYYDWERFQHHGPVRIPAFDETTLGPDGRPIRFEDTAAVDRLVYPRSQVDLANYRFEWFEEDMDAARRLFSREQATDDNLANVISIAEKQAENGGRHTILRAVDTDPQVVGWARVEGTENIGSCGFCAMLISRGPVYKESEYAGLDIDDVVEAVEVYQQAEQSGDDRELMKLMNRWHPNCDCKVVPVFDRRNWKGRDEYLRYEKLWIKYTKGLYGQDALRAFRRAIESGYATDEDAPAVLRPAA